MRKQESALPLWGITLLFIYKVIWGSLYGWLFLNYYHGDDTWQIHEEIIGQTRLLLEAPLRFIYECTPFYSWEKSSGTVTSFLSRWINDMEWNLLRKPLAILNIISNDSYYINLTFVNFISFWGLFWIYQAMRKHFPNAGPWIILVVFILPNGAFWLSGLRAEIWLVFFTGLFIKGCTLPKQQRQRLIQAIGWIGIFIIRKEFALVMLPAWIAWEWWKKDQQQLKQKFLWLYTCTISLFIIASILIPGHYPWQWIVERQAAFNQLSGTRMPLTPLTNDFPDWLKVFPQSVLNTFIRPLLNEAESLLQIAFSLWQLMILGSFLLYAMLYRKPSLRPPYDLQARAWLHFLIIWSVSVYIIIGLIVPFPGAIIRYKVIPEILLICCLVVSWRSRIKPQIKSYYKK